MTRTIFAVAVASLIACAGSEPAGDTQVSAPSAHAPVADLAGVASRPPTAEPPASPAPVAPLEVKWLGVDGFVLSYGGDTVLTAPLFTRPNMFEVSSGLPARSDADAVTAGLDVETLSSLRAVLAGHAHYDHLLDVPTVLQRAPQATLFSNVSARNLLAAFAPDRAAKCAGTPAQVPAIARSRVVAFDDPLASSVDWRNCPAKKPVGAPLEGKWVNVPGSNVRVLAVCSDHPDQVGPYHFGPGDVTEEVCQPPSKMADWKEGRTLAFLVDFLDPKSGAPVYRVYYQDAPAETPMAQIPSEFLSEKRVDLALLCVGSSNNVTGQPSELLQQMDPRFAIGGHWEDFFRGADETPQPITFLDPHAWEARAIDALPVLDAEGTRWTVNGAPMTERAIVPQPGDAFVVTR